MAHKFRSVETTGLQGAFLGNDVWRAMLGMEAFPALLFFIACVIIAESPRWLAEKGHLLEAQAVLKRISGSEIAAAVSEESGLLS